ncbi:hypothetical protein [Sphingomonas sp. Leaf38]|uniref:gp53-like domain-containing protein n=1 Tax=Sphingomonas sp. Leaf38 TaxID=1736217 RepID=UPI000700307D|nr:hypothetical protein [Sphingomonas sp. Leaf38]KQN29701.1 hypothetical protein ASE88_12630 [Sphingomonas sp. Leaf38]
MILPALALTMTTLGLQRFTAAQVEDDIDLSISHVGLTDTAFVVAPTLTALPGEFRRLDTISGKPVGNNIVHMVLRDDADLTYGVRGLGLFLADGTLFAVVGQVERIFVKAQVASFLLAIDVAFPTAEINQISFGDTNFLYPPATETTRGVATIASQAQVDAEADDATIVTPKKLGVRLLAMFGALNGYVPLTQRGAANGVATLGGTAKVPVDQLPAASAASAGIARRATQDLVDAGTDDDRFVSSLTLAQRLLGYVANTQRAVANGIATLDAEAKVPAAQIRAATATQVEEGLSVSAFVTPAGLKAGDYLRVEEYVVEGSFWYRRTSDGFVEMSGISALPGSESTFTLNFPRPFPTMCLGLWATIINTAQSNDGQSTVQEVSLSADHAVLFAQNHKTPTADANGGFRWLARGR